MMNLTAPSVAEHGPRVKPTAAHLASNPAAAPDAGFSRLEINQAWTVPEARPKRLLTRGAATFRFDIFRGFFYIFVMAEIATPEVMPDFERQEKSGEKTELEPGFLVVCWNDPVNFMDYVTHVFQKIFGWPKAKAELHMMQVHNEGKSVLAREGLEKAEHYVHLLQQYRLHATLERE
jgi:ATP-dependent Clp protease adaptor protein ClpS